MAVEPLNIIIGAGTMYLAATGTADASMVDAANDVGGTSGGVELAYEPEYKDIEVDQEFAIIDKKKIREKATVKTQMSEATLNNILLAWGLPAARLNGGTLSFGESSVSSATARQMYIVGKGPNGQDRTVKLWRVVAQGNASVAFKKDDITMLNVEFAVLSSATKAGGGNTAAGEKMGQIVDASYDGSAPTIVTFLPADAAAAVAVNAVVQVTFSDDMLTSTLTLANCQLIDSTTGLNMATGVTYDSVNKRIALTHANLAGTRAYFTKITTDVKNSSGIPMATEGVAKFTTV